MSSLQIREARVTADVATGIVTATVDVAARPERVYRALASTHVIDWWVRPGVFDTRAWTGDVRVGGSWSSSGVGRGEPYTLEGEFLEVDSPRALAHTWHLRGTPSAPTTVAYELEPHNEGTRLTLRHSGFTSPQACENTATAWQTSLDRLVEMFGRSVTSSGA